VLTAADADRATRLFAAARNAWSAGDAARARCAPRPVPWPTTAFYVPTSIGCGDGQQTRVSPGSTPQPPSAALSSDHDGGDATRVTELFEASLSHHASANRRMTALACSWRTGSSCAASSGAWTRAVLSEQP
jgi:hypothetical protein